MRSSDIAKLGRHARPHEPTIPEQLCLVGDDRQCCLCRRHYTPPIDGDVGACPIHEEHVRKQLVTMAARHDREHEADYLLPWENQPCWCGHRSTCDATCKIRAPLRVADALQHLAEP